MVCASFFVPSNGQIKPIEIKELEIGDTIPPLLVQNIIHQDRDQIHVPDLYPHGMLLLEFWATWCGPCIAQMRQMDALKKKFPNLRSLAVTSEDSTVVKNFFSMPGNSSINPKDLIIATNDTTLRQYFPHRILPHNIWIDSTGVIRAITDGRKVTEEHIGRFLDGQGMEGVNQKKDREDFDFLKPFHLGDSIFGYRSIMTPRISGINSGSLVDGQDRKIKRFFAWNTSVANLYWKAYMDFQIIKSDLLEIRAQDTLRFEMPSDAYFQKAKSDSSTSAYKNLEEWREKNIYCYELILPEAVADTVFAEYMMQDLNRFFGYRAQVVYKDMPCIVLIENGKGVDLPPTRQPDANPYISFDYPRLTGTNINLDDLVDYLWGKGYFKNNKRPIVNGIGETDAFDLNVDFSELLGSDLGKKGISFSMVLEKLEEIGIAASYVNHPYPTLTISDK